MADICAGAGLSPGVVYRYFASKDALIGAIMEQHVSESLDDASASANGISALRGFARHMLGGGGPDGEMRLRAELLLEARRRPEFLRQLAQVRALAEKSLTDLIVLAQQRGEFRSSLDPALAAASLLCVLDGLIFSAITTADSALAADDAVAFFERAASAILLNTNDLKLRSAHPIAYKGGPDAAGSLGLSA